MAHRIFITARWDGTPLDNADVVRVVIDEVGREIMVQFTAHLTPAYTVPPAPVGFTHGLWDYDVVELFFARPDGSYVEIEVGPAGHWLVYEFSGYRVVSDKSQRPFQYATRVQGGEWHGSFIVPNAWIKCSLQECRVNVYQIRSTEQGREYIAWRSIPTIAPDFHRVECFESLK